MKLRQKSLKIHENTASKLQNCDSSNACERIYNTCKEYFKMLERIMSLFILLKSTGRKDQKLRLLSLVNRGRCFDSRCSERYVTRGQDLAEKRKSTTSSEESKKECGNLPVLNHVLRQ